MTQAKPDGAVWARGCHCHRCTRRPSPLPYALLALGVMVAIVGLWTLMEMMI